MSVDKAKLAIETGIRTVEASKESLDKSNSDVAHVGTFIAHIWARLEGLQLALLRFDVEHQTHLIGPRISQAEEALGPVIDDTFSCLKAPGYKKTENMFSCAEKLRDGLADQAEVVTGLILTLGAIHDGIAPLLEQARSTAEGCAAAAENGAKLTQYHTEIITGLEGYKL